MKLWKLLPTLLLALLVSREADAQSEFPREGLEDRIEFWSKVYTDYGEDDVIIHDGYHVNLIYAVAAEDNARQRVREIRDALHEISSNLNNPETLSTNALGVYSAIQKSGLSIDNRLIGQLRTGVHTQRGIKERFRDGIVRSGRYLPSFQQIFREHGVPVDLALLPLVESSFQNVRSKAGASGIWQFTRGTGRLYMKINSRTDERSDPDKATRAAARLLRDNYRALGVWPLAITAYNHGQAGMKRAKSEIGSDLTKIIRDYDGPYFGFASSNFYAEFLAAVDVYRDYERHFGKLTLDRPQPVIRAASLETGEMKPAPKSGGSRSTYRVQSGDTLSEIAERFGTTIRDLMRLNNLQQSVIFAGQILSIR